MAPPGRAVERYRREVADYAVERYSVDGRPLVQNGQMILQNGQGMLQNGQGMLQQGRSNIPQLVAPDGRPLSFYEIRQILTMGPPFPDVRMIGRDGQLLTAKETRQILERGPPFIAEDDKEVNTSPQAYENREAIKQYNRRNKEGKLREGRHAAAVDQIHENHLHQIKKVQEQPKDKEDEGANGRGRPGPNYLLYHELDTGQITGLQHRPVIRPENDPDSELTTSFDPMKDRHMWTMWRTAVNGRIVDEVRRLERIKTEQGPEATMQMDLDNPGVYGRALTAPPLKRFIRFDNGSKQIAQQLSNLGQGQLLTSQFVYYGLPRVYVSNPKKMPPPALPPPETVPQDGLRAIEYPSAEYTSRPTMLN